MARDNSVLQAPQEHECDFYKDMIMAGAKSTVTIYGQTFNSKAEFIRFEAPSMAADIIREVAFDSINNERPIDLNKVDLSKVCIRIGQVLKEHGYPTAQRNIARLIDNPNWKYHGINAEALPDSLDF